MSSGEATGRVKILKRQVKPSEPATNANTHERPTSATESVAGEEKDRLYESARAEILGEDFDSAVPQTGYATGADSRSTKALYRGRDYSEMDPDYMREPEYGVVYFPVMQPVGHPPGGPSVEEQYPSLGEVYRSGQAPR
jgi:hypothetical protein